MASPTPVGSNVNFTALVSGTTSTTVSSYTVPSTGGNRGLVVILFTDNGNDAYVSGLTWDGVAMSDVYMAPGVKIGGGIVFLLNNPNLGNKNLVISYSSAPAQVSGIIFTLQDVDGPVLDSDGNDTNVTATNSISNSIPTASNNALVVGWSLIGTGATSISSDVGTNLGSQISGGNGNIIQASYIEKALTGTQNMTFNWTNNVNADMFMVSFKYLPFSKPFSPFPSHYNI